MYGREVVKSCSSPGKFISLASTMLADLVHPMLSFAVLICCLPFLFVVSLVYRLSYNAVISNIIKKNSDVIIVQPQDALCLRKSETDTAILNCLLLLKGKADLARIRKLIQDRLVEARGENGNLLLPKLTRCHTSFAGFTVWVKDETFDIRDYVFKCTSQSPRTREEMETLLGYLMSQTLPKNKSPWQTVVIPSSSMLEKQCFILFRFHHCIADSANFNEIILRQLTDIKPQPFQKLFSGATKKYIQALKMLSSGPSVLIQKLSVPVEDHRLYGQPLSRDKLVSWSEQLDSALIKEMARVSKSSSGAILMSCLSGALRDYFRHHSHKIPDDILVSVSYPSEISPDMHVSDENHAVFVLMSLPLQLADPIRQLQAIKSRIDTSMNSVEPALNALMTSQFMGRMPLWLTSLLNRTIADKSTVVLSEVSCPESKVFIGGNAVEDVIIWSGQPTNVGIGMSLVSYNGQAKLTIMVDRAIMNDPSLLLNSFETRLDNLARMLNVL